MTVEEHISNGDVLGIIVDQGLLKIYMAPSIWFVMNYESYYPSAMEIRDRRGRYNGPLFREDVRVVNSLNADVYLNHMEKNILQPKDIIKIKEKDAESIQPIFLIDFDHHRYVSWFYDIDYEEYIPNGWEGIFDNPLNFLPDEIKAIWD